MAKPSKIQFSDLPLDQEPIVQPTALENKTQSEYDKVGLRLVYPAHVVHTGLVTGEQYDWPDAGSITMVDSRDVDELLALRIGGIGCCGGSGNAGGYPYFELVR